MKNTKVLGVDIGNVIINRRNYVPKTNHIDQEAYAPFQPTENVFESLHTLVKYFGGKVFLISKCSKGAEAQILNWLTFHDFYSRTGIDKQNIFFVRERNEKNRACIELGITHFIDDRLEVLSYMTESTPYLYLFEPNQHEVDMYKTFLPNVTVLNGWTDAIQKIIFNIE